jgi:hypothetical protein
LNSILTLSGYICRHGSIDECDDFVYMMSLFGLRTVAQSAMNWDRWKGGSWLVFSDWGPYLMSSFVVAGQLYLRQGSLKEHTLLWTLKSVLSKD